MLKEAQRCLRCQKPSCQAACPVSTAIPKVIDLYLSGKIKEAGEILFANNPLSVITSLVCPHEKQCMGNCILGKKREPINIGEIEHMVSLHFLKNTNFVPRDFNGKRIAIIGSGPAGLTIAFILSQKGYRVTVFEENDKIGGVLQYGIPEFRLPKNIISILEEKLFQLGVKIRYNTLIGPVLTLEDLFRDDYAAIFIGTGVWRAVKMGLPGESLGNVHYAIDYLKNPNVYRLGNSLNVIGAGNVAMDVARTALRNGVIKVNIIYRNSEETMSANKEEIALAKKEGVNFIFFRQPEKLTEQGIICHKTELQDGKLIVLSDTEEIASESIIISIGQGPRANIVATTKNLVLNERGLIKTDQLGRTSKPGVFASGDVVTGARTVVEAVNIASKVANAIEDYLNN